jgi:hypothetical protein
VGARILAEARRIRPLDRACFLEPIDELDPIAQPIRLDAEGRGPAIDEVQSQVVAGKEGWRSGFGGGRQAFVPVIPSGCKQRATAGRT